MSAHIFYEKLSKYYTKIFPLNYEEIQFLKEEFAIGNMLDVACGDGQYTLALLKEGYDAYGCDINLEMLRSAKKEYSDRFFVRDMTNLHSLEKFNNIFCIGTSLAHLKDKKAVEKTLQSFYNLLEEGGVVILHTVNFDRVIKHNITALPTIAKDNLTFERHYTILGEEIDFTSVLKVGVPKGQEEAYTNTVRLLGLSSSYIKKILEEQGFADIRLHNGFSLEPFCEYTSFGVVYVAKK